MDFKLHPNLASKLFITDFPLCRVLLEDERHYPWLLLVPRKMGSSRLMDLSMEQQIQIMKELDLVQNILYEEFKPTQLNVAAIGNKTPQLHVHVIARYCEDPAWPGTVWDHPVRSPYSDEERKVKVEHLKAVCEEKVRGNGFYHFA